jgi:hypothetical protein
MRNDSYNMGRRSWKKENIERMEDERTSTQRKMTLSKVDEEDWTTRHE